MTQDIEKYAQAIMDVGAEVDSHIDGDARIQTFTFNEAQVVAFAELVADEARREERENIIEKLKGEAQVYTGNTPLCVSVEDIDAIAHLSDK